MPELDLCINTQTPLLQFATHLAGTAFERAWDPEVDLADLKEGEEYRYSPGGVTRMVYPFVKWMTARGLVRSAHWIALNPTGPRVVRLPGLTLHNLRLPTERVGAYGRTKEAIWSAAHGTGELAPPEDLFWSEEFSEYAFYNRHTAEYIRGLDRAEDFDLFYIHDFQQLQVGSMLDTLKPKLFRWHIPFERSAVPESWQPAVLRSLQSYDTVIVSADRYRAALKSFGVTGRVVRVFPYVDPTEYHRPTPDVVQATLARWAVPPEAPVALVVGRMDPVKGQDRAIRAFARVLPQVPEARLVLVGNGSFSGSSAGLGLSKTATWRAHLEELAVELGVQARVVFAGHTSQAELDAWYERASFTVLPSIREGFGLVVVESWIHERPAVVSRAAGVADLVENGKNGFSLDPDSTEQFAHALLRLFRDDGTLRRKLVAGSRASLEAVSFERAMESETGLLKELVVA